MNNSGHFGPPLPFWAPRPPALPGLPMASYATVAERLCADLGGPVTASAESLSLVDYRTILLARATRDAATAAAAAAAWELAQVLPGGWVGRCVSGRREHALPCSARPGSAARPERRCSCVRRCLLAPSVAHHLTIFSLLSTRYPSG